MHTFRIQRSISPLVYPMATHIWIALHSMSFTFKTIFKPVYTRKPLRVVFWSFRYLLSWHLNIQIVLHCCWHVLFLSLSYFMHICFISLQLDCNIFEFRWCVTFSFTHILFAVENLGIQYLLLILISFCFIGGWQVKIFLISRQGGELNRNEYSPIFSCLQSERSYPQICFLTVFSLVQEGEQSSSMKTLDLFPWHSCFTFFLLLSTILFFEKNYSRWLVNRIWKYNNLM